MAINWRTYGPSTLISALDKTEFPGFFQNIVVGPNEAAIIIRDGTIEETITGTRKNTSGLWDQFKTLWGRSSNLEIIFINTSPIDFTFYVGTSSRKENGLQAGQLSDSSEDAYNTIDAWARSRNDATDLTIVALTSDGQTISAEVNVTLRLRTDNAPLLTSLLRGRPALADWDIATLVRDELLAKSFVPLLGQYSGSEIRANKGLLEQLSQDAQITLQNKIDLYGLDLINMYINWGLTEEDALVIAEGKKNRESRAIEFDHSRNIRDLQKELELEHHRISNLQELHRLEATGDVDLQEIILAGQTNRDNLVDGKKLNQSAIAAEVKDIELGVQKKENLLKIETTKAEADVRFAIGQRQALFDEELAQIQADRRQRDLMAESTRDMAELAELSRLQNERQTAKSQVESQATRQAFDAGQASLRARLDASLSETEQEQQTIRQALINSPDAVDSSVLREMLKQGTNRVFSETSDEKMESLSESQRDPLAIESPVQEDSTGQREMASSGGETGRERSLGGAKCNSCSFLIQEGWKVCPSCGTAITVLCRHCGAELKPGWNNCPECGLATDR